MSRLTSQMTFVVGGLRGPGLTADDQALLDEALAAIPDIAGAGTAAIAGINAARTAAQGVIAAEGGAQVTAAQGAALEARGYRDQTQAAAGALFFSGTTGLPLTSTPVTGTAWPASTIVYPSEKATRNRSYTQVRLFNLGNTSRVIKLRRMKADGSGNYVQVAGSSEMSVTIPAGPGVQTVAIAGGFTVASGEVLGFYVPASTLSYLSEVPDSGGFRNTAGDVTTVTAGNLAYQFQLQIGFDYSEAATDGAALVASKQSLDKSADLYAGFVQAGVTFRPPTATLSAASGAGAGNYIQNDPATTKRRYTSLSIYAASASSQQIVLKKFQSSDGQNFTRVQGEPQIALKLAAGPSVQTFVIDWTLEAGQYIGFYTPTGAVGFTNAAGDQGGYFYQSGANSDAVVDTDGPTTGVRLQLSMAYTALPRQLPGYLTFNATNCGRITFVGDSLIADAMQMEAKAWTQWLAAMTDWTIDTYAVGGSTLQQRTAAIRADTLVWGAGFSAHRPTYVVGMSGQNDATAGISADDFRTDWREFVETIRGLGAIPVIASEQRETFIYGGDGSALYAQCADEFGVDYINVRAVARILGNEATYPPFWVTMHPGIRANGFYIQSFLHWIQSLGRPRSALKVFRPRAGVAVATVNDLYYRDDRDFYARTQKWREINIGHGALATPERYDELDTVSGSVLFNSEYLALANGGSISFNNYALIEFVLPHTSSSISGLTLTLSIANADAVYVPNHLGGALDANIGAWTQLTGSNGVYAIDDATLRQAMRFDKLPILVAKAGTFSMASPSITYKPAGAEKRQPLITNVRGRARGVERLTTTAFPTSGAPTGWTVTGAVVGATPVDSVVPRGGTGVVVVNSSNYVSQPFTVPKDNYQDTEIEVRVTARIKPVIYASSAGTYPAGSQFTPDSFDPKKVFMQVGDVRQWRTAGPAWMELVFRTIVPHSTDLPADTTTMTLTLSAESDVQIGTVSVKALV